jgi:2'-5' RNA ligase
VALNLPDATRRSLWAATERLRQRDLPVTWVRPEGIHMTLKFLGETDDDRATELGSALQRAAQGARSLPLVLQGFGAFPDTNRPRVLWVGIDPEPALELLQNAIEREFAPLGFPTEVRPFRPHVTIGRARRDAKPSGFRGLEATLDALQFNETVVIESVDLMRSQLGPGGSTYSVQHAERLS